MKIFLTGATGFFGSHLARKFLEDGHEVLALRRPTSSTARLEEIKKRIRWCSWESVLGEDSSALTGVEVVVHTAANYGRKGEALADIVETNTLTPLRLLEAAIRKKVPKFIHTDSALPSATNAYALSKAQFSRWGEFVARVGAIDFINLRLEHFYGPNDDELKFTCHVINTCLQNKPELKLTSGRQQRDFLYIADAVDALSTVIGAFDRIPRGFVEIPLGSGVAIPVRDFVELVHQLTNSTTKLVFSAIPESGHDVEYSCADLTFMNRLGWTPMTNLRTGLELSIRGVSSS